MAAQVSLCLAWLETPEDTFSHGVAEIYSKPQCKRSNGWLPSSGADLSPSRENMTTNGDRGPRLVPRTGRGPRLVPRIGRKHFDG